MKEIFEFLANNWALTVIFGNFLVASSYIVSKVLLKDTFGKPLPPAPYVFYSGLGGIFLLGFGLIFNLFFHFLLFDFWTIFFGTISGIVLILGLWPFYQVLERNEASRVTALLIGTTPLTAFVLKYLFMGERLGLLKILALFFLIIGGILISFKKVKGRKLDIKDSLLTILSGFAFALGLVLAEIAFKSYGFFNGLVWLGSGYIIASLIVFLWPNQKNKIIKTGNYAGKRNFFLFFLEKTLSIAGTNLIKFSVTIVSATIVSAFEGIKQFFVLIWAKIMSQFFPKIYKEELRGVIFWKKFFAAILIFIGIFLLFFSDSIKANPNRKIVWGVSFSSQFSKRLNADWQKTFLAILDELRPTKVRIVAYWEDTQKTEDSFDFSDLDWQMAELQKRNIKTIMVIGMRVPRWPECHIPSWANSLSAEDRENKLKNYLEKIVRRYQYYSVLESWQVENEPFLIFGECPGRRDNFLLNEIDLVKSIDSRHQIIITDGGEFGTWYRAVKYGDIFGTTMYRRVHSNTLGYFDYHLPPEFFIVKEKISRFLTGKYDKKFIVSELAAEPWQEKQLYETPIVDHFKYFDYDFFIDTIRYAKATDFDEYYFWGAEWWHFLKMNGYPQIWDEAKKLW